MRQYQRRNQKNKIDKNLTNIGKRVVKYTDVYDDRDNVVGDGNEIKLESQLRKEIKQRQKPVQAWHVMKQVAQDKARKGNTKMKIINSGVLVNKS